MQINGIDITISKQKYNKTEVQDDGITHKVNTDKEYTMYSLQMFKNYFDSNTDEEVVRSIINDLKAVTRKLETLLEQDKENTR